MKNIPQSILFTAIALLFITSIGITALVANSSGNSEQYEKEIAELEADIEDQEERIDTCVTVMDEAVTAVAYYAFSLNYVAEYFETQDASKLDSAISFKEEAVDTTDRYSTEQVDACREGN